MRIGPLVSAAVFLVLLSGIFFPRYGGNFFSSSQTPSEGSSPGGQAVIDIANVSIKVFSLLESNRFESKRYHEEPQRLVLNDLGEFSSISYLLKPERVVVKSLGASEFSLASSEDLHSPEVLKYYLDPWGAPYMYSSSLHGVRARSTHYSEGRFLFWSFGPDGVNNLMPAFNVKSCGDDVGNW